MYLICLMVAIAGLMFADWRHRLALFADWRRAVRTIVSAVAIFLIWDILGVSLGIFFPGHSSVTTGWFVLPGIPLEEIGFLWLLCYLTLILFTFWERRWLHTSASTSQS